MQQWLNNAPFMSSTSEGNIPTVNTDYMNAHLTFVSEHVGLNRQVLLVLDQAGWHSSKTLNVPDNITCRLTVLN